MKQRDGSDVVSFTMPSFTKTNTMNSQEIIKALNLNPTSNIAANVKRIEQDMPERMPVLVKYVRQGDRNGFYQSVTNGVQLLQSMGDTKGTNY